MTETKKKTAFENFYMNPTTSAANKIRLKHMDEKENEIKINMQKNREKKDRCKEDMDCQTSTLVYEEDLNILQQLIDEIKVPIFYLK